MTVYSKTCVALGCDEGLRCHRCATAEGVRERFVVDEMPCLSGQSSKMTGHFTHGCDKCIEEHRIDVVLHTYDG